ncbi:MAG: type VI secretion system protein TssA [Phycisphaeraceae bacterium]|nr:MAG: type VI secretion system protein TssA [Phycisphaeraceae bacterium]
MALIDIEKLLGEISPDEPCGPDLEYDGDFIALMHDAEGRPPKLTPDGQLVEEGEDPNWRDVRNRCVAMFDRTVDLRVGLVLVNALMCDAGMAGLRDGLELLKTMCERHWDHLHPQLDPDDDNDPTMRMNLVSAFAAPIGADGDPRRFQQRLREVPLAESRQLGRFNLRDLLIAAGEITPPAGAASVPNEGLIDGAFQDTDGDGLKETGKAAEACVELSKALDKWITSKVGASQACDLSPWHNALGDLHKRLTQRIEARFPGETTQEDAAPAGGPPSADGAGAPLTGAINSRDDVIRALQKVLEYYARQEPSSPIPLLVRRAQRMVTMNFVDIIRELSPGALDQIRVIGGDESMSAAPVPIPASTPAAPAPKAPPPPAKPASTGGEPIRLGADFAPR